MSLEMIAQCFGDLNEGLSWRAVWIADRDRHAAVAAFAYFGVDRNFAEKRDALASGFDSAAAVAKNFDALAARRGEIAHVLDDAEDRDVDFLEHRDPFADD